MSGYERKQALAVERSSEVVGYVSCCLLDHVASNTSAERCTAVSTDGDGEIRGLADSRERRRQRTGSRMQPAQPRQMTIVTATLKC